MPSPRLKYGRLQKKCSNSFGKRAMASDVSYGAVGSTVGFRGSKVQREMFITDCKQWSDPAELEADMSVSFTSLFVDMCL